MDAVCDDSTSSIASENVDTSKKIEGGEQHEKEESKWLSRALDFIDFIVFGTTRHGPVELFKVQGWTLGISSVEGSRRINFQG